MSTSHSGGAAGHRRRRGDGPGVRGRLSAVAAVAVPVLILAACGGGDGGATSSQDEPLRIAVVTSQTGPYATIGEQATRAAQFAAEQANGNGGVDGHQVEVVVIDDNGTVEGAIQATERAVQREEAPFITGTVASSQSLAIASRIEALDGVYISTISKTNRLTGEDCSPRVFRANKNDRMDLNTVEPWLQERDEPDWVALGADYEWGHDSVGSFVETAEKLDRTVHETLFPPLGTGDYGSYISQLGAADADGLWVSLSGGDSVKFARQASQFGLFDRFSAVIGNNFVTDNIMETVGEPLLGVWGTVNYTYTIETPQNEAFVTAWQEAHEGDNPTNFEGETYVGMQMLFAAVEAAGSVEPEAVADAMNGLTFETVFGNSTMRAEDHQLLTPNYIGQVQRVEGDLAYEITLEADAEQISPEPNSACGL